MRNIVLLAHADPSVAPLYRAALAGVPGAWEVHPFIGPPLSGVPGGGLSGRYDALVRRLDTEARGGGKVDRLLRYLDLAPKAEGDRAILVTWSGGYPMALWAMSDPALDGVVWLDSGHANEVAPHVPDPARIAPAVEYAKRAHLGDVLFYLMHTDIDPRVYASTTEVAAAIEAAAGGEGGLLHVARFPGATAQDHIDALRTDGPPFVARAIRAMLGISTAAAPETPMPATLPAYVLRRGDQGDAVRRLQELLRSAGYDPGPADGAFGPRTQGAVRTFQVATGRVATGDADAATLAALQATGTPSPAPQPVSDADGLGLRALRVALGELGQHEIPGPRANPRIEAYIAGAVRNGRPVFGDHAGDEPAWCACLVGFSDHAAALPGGVVPPWRAAVAEVWRDAVARGAARDRSYRPKPGDLVIFRRSGGDPRMGGSGHVARVAEILDDATYRTVGGNESDQVALAVRRFDDPMLVGFVAYP